MRTRTHLGVLSRRVGNRTGPVRAPRGAHVVLLPLIAQRRILGVCVEMG